MSKRFKIARLEAHYKRVLQYLPGMIGRDAVNFFVDNFRRQGFLGARLEPWKKRRARNRAGRAILVKSGRLRRSIRITKIQAGTIVVGTDVPYARAHNEGFRGTVQVAAHTRNKYTKTKELTGKLTKLGKARTKTVKRVTGSVQVKAHTKRMNLPRRQFMGESPYLKTIISRRIMAEIKKGHRI